MNTEDRSHHAHGVSEHVHEALDEIRTKAALVPGRDAVAYGGSKAALLAYGSMVPASVSAGEILGKEGIRPTVVNARFVKPLDVALIKELAETHDAIVTVEEAYLAGGFGSAVIEALEELGLQDAVKVVRLGVPDEIVTHGDAATLLSGYGLDAAGIATATRNALLQTGGAVRSEKLRAVK